MQDGSLVYRNARRRNAWSQRGQASAQALVITSVPEESRRLKYDDDIVVSADVIDEEVASEKTGWQTLRKIFDDLKTKPKNVSPRRLEEIWGALRDLGIERFPLHRGDFPPQDVPSITVIERDRQWIFVKYDRTILALGPDEQRELVGVWTQCQYTIVNAYSD